MPSRENLAKKRIRPLGKPANFLNSASWENEIREVLTSARQARGTGASDPDWQKVSRFLLRHCREALGDCR
jgi:hypothetical protein